ncbi:MAG: hypothetical protein HY851_09165 [candidate division Zixibacteria bacterium]|nr:hypothetical protein [candidate division Zixibacteria bacterium]
MSSLRFIALILTAGLVTGWYLGVYRPSCRQSEDIDQQLQVAANQLQEYQTAIQQLPELLRAGSELEGTKRRQNAALFAKEDILKMFDQLTAEAANENMSIAEIAPPLSELLTLNAAPRHPGEPLYLNVTVRVMGDYAGFGRFVERVERLPYFRGVNIMSILGTADKSAPLVYSIGYKAMLRSGEGTV